jgi:NDP-sugar pyrophosphorylase family protein
MVVRRLKSGEAYARLDIDNDGRLKGFGRGRYMYTGVQVLGPAIFKFLKRPSCLIETGYKRLLANGLPVRTFLYKGYWNDVGTMERLKSANGEM